MLKKINQQNFNDEVLKNDGLVLIDFYADWCGPCRMLGPIVEQVAAARPDITVGKINIDENEALAVQYNVSTIPTLIVFKDGKEQSRSVGVRSKASILAQL